MLRVQGRPSRSPCTRRSERFRERSFESIDIFGIADGDADAAILRCRKGHPDEDVARHQFGEHRTGEIAVGATIDGHEIGGRGQGGEPVRRRNFRNPPARDRDFGTHFIEVCLVEQRGERPRLIAIGASTGGVEALQILLQGFPADCPPTLVVQHINGHFAEAVARRLDQSSAPTVTIAEPDLQLKQGHVYMAPGTERHLQVRGGSGLFARMRPGDKVSGHRPSVDMLFHSVAEALGSEAIGILLTGMGQDGAHGLLAMARAGAATIVQDEATSTVFGMPKAAIGLGAAKLVAPIQRIADHAFARAA